MAKRIPSLNWLRVFEAAARTNSFARAAERLAMSPPAVSQQIRALEEHLGRPLFERAPAGVSLTEAGRRLLVVASDAIGRMEAAAESLSTPGGPPLIVAVSQTLYTGWLAPRLNGFLEDHPSISLQVRSLVGPEIPPREATIWISFGQPPPGTDSTPLFGETLVPVATPECAKIIRTPSDMLDFTLIEVADHRRNWAYIFGLDVLPKQAKTIEVDTTLAALTLAGHGCGLAIARPPASDDLVRRFGLVPSVGGIALPGVEQYHVLSNSGVHLDRDAASFKDWLLAEARSIEGKK